MTEPDVTLTDYALAVECAVLAILALRWSAVDSRQARSWGVMFASIGLGSVFGGTVHGFVQDETTRGYVVLWGATLLALGVASTALWFAGSYATLSRGAGRALRAAAIAALVVFTVVVLFVSQRFVVAIVSYLPATIFALVAFGIAYARDRRRALLAGLAGLLLTLVAAGVQQARIAVHPVYFNHNALYHVMQFGALLLVWFGARELSSSGRNQQEH